MQENNWPVDEPLPAPLTPMQIYRYQQQIAAMKQQQQVRERSPPRWGGGGGEFHGTDRSGPMGFGGEVREESKGEVVQLKRVP